jgi:hypothetical protein
LTRSATTALNYAYFTVLHVIAGYVANRSWALKSNATRPHQTPEYLSSLVAQMRDACAAAVRR